jgi:hypothetical protein
LPSSMPRPKPPVSGNTSLRNIVGDTPTKSAWGGGGGANVETVRDVDSIAVGEVERESPKGKKGKGKQKQTLFTLGSIPT